MVQKGDKIRDKFQILFNISKKFEFASEPINEKNFTFRTITFLLLEDPKSYILDIITEALHQKHF